jgi:hypothetical protein
MLTIAASRLHVSWPLRFLLFARGIASLFVVGGVVVAYVHLITYWTPWPPKCLQ